MTPPPANPKLYHIVHVDKLASIVADGRLLCDAVMAPRANAGTVIGMTDIKTRRLTLPVKCHQGLHVGDCVPFYFCPRSVMLYLIYQANHPELTYRGGQGPIVHLEFDLNQVVEWAGAQGLRWAFTLSNAGSYYFEDRCDLADLGDVEWDAVNARMPARPNAPPASEIKIASVNTPRRMRLRLDPSANRNAISRERSAARAANRLPRLAHAASRMSPARSIMPEMNPFTTGPSMSPARLGRASEKVMSASVLG